MKNIFFKFRPANEDKCIRIKPLIKYDILDVINSDSPLIKLNKFEIANGRIFFDIVQFDDSLNFAISERIKDLLERNNISGWSCFPIEIINSTNKYFGFHNLSKAGPILNLDALNNYETEFTKFDISTWDGSDIFNLENTLLNVCTKKVKELFELSNVTNIKINPL